MFSAFLSQMTQNKPLVAEDEDLYSILGLPAYPGGKSCTEGQIKKAYYAQALKHHPDRHSSANAASNQTEEFQRINFAYSILSDAGKRKVYDSTGRMSTASGDVDWTDYFNEIHQKITIEDILKFEQQYKGSKEEEQDLVNAYLDAKGDMGRILELVPLCTVDDEERFRELLLKQIENKSIRAYAKFTKESPKEREKRKREAEKEALEAEELAKELGLDKVLRGEKGKKQTKSSNGKDEEQVDPELMNLIRNRGQQRFDDLISGLEAKYSNKTTSKKNKKQKQ